MLNCEPSRPAGYPELSTSGKATTMIGSKSLLLEQRAERKRRQKSLHVCRSYQGVSRVVREELQIALLKF